MAGLYYHIPFCKQACHYCDFHFSTQLKSKPSVISAMLQELNLRAQELKAPLRSIYFGGGTPSLLTTKELSQLIEGGRNLGLAKPDIEITLEVNPDDVTPERLKDWKAAGINRLSLGIQSFSTRDLKFMNRAHDAEQAHQSLVWIARQFENFSVDLIYGIPQQQGDSWLNNLAIIGEFKPPHLSCYALTRESGTAMDKFIQRGVMPDIDEGQAQSEYEILVDWAEQQGYVNYEFSNFALKGYESVNNSAYWSGLPYLGIGPSAHSYDGHTRSWNIASNPLYLKALAQDKLPITRETLTPVDRYNEYVMTRLRTASGIDLREVSRLFDEKTCENLLSMAAKHIDQGLLARNAHQLKVTPQGKFLTDGIASELFLVNLGS
jgi:oxygen-independent coproporphyrinogen-3 oxidase